jgi:hypothetical protein
MLSRYLSVDEGPTYRAEIRSSFQQRPAVATKLAAGY